MCSSDLIAAEIEGRAGSGVYNEVVIGAESYVASLPWAVEAFVFPVGDKDTNAEEERKARALHSRFLHTYRLTAHDVPLFRVDVSDFTEPFALAS